MLEGEARTLERRGRSAAAAPAAVLSASLHRPDPGAAGVDPPARKPLADIGGVPMVVRVAQRAAQSGAASVVVAADAAEIVAACTRAWRRRRC